MISITLILNNIPGQRTKPMEEWRVTQWRLLKTKNKNLFTNQTELWRPSYLTIPSETRLYKAHSRAQLSFPCLLFSGSIPICCSTNCQISLSRIHSYSWQMGFWLSGYLGGPWKALKMLLFGQVPSLRPHSYDHRRCKSRALSSDWNNYYNGLSISSTFLLLKESVNAFTMCPWVNTTICCFHILYHLLSFFVTQILDLWFPGQIDVTSLTQVVFLWTLPSPSWGQLITSLVSLVCNYASVRA